MSAKASTPYISNFTMTEVQSPLMMSTMLSLPNNGAKKIIQIGCGVVGAAYMNAFRWKGHNVVGIECSPDIIKSIGNTYKMYSISDDLSELVGIDIIMISVCTPVKGDGRLDMSYIYSTLGNVSELVRNNPSSTVVIRSTVTPGTILKYKKALEDKLDRRHDNLCFQPEFLRAKSAIDDAMYPWYVVIGTCGKGVPAALNDIYLDFVDMERIRVMPVEEAELLKIFHNSFNAAKISFFNQCDLLCKEMNKKNGTRIDTNNITETLINTCEGLRNAQYGTKAGHGFYGSCLPKDSSELRGLESEYGLASHLFAEVVHVNNEVVRIDKIENRGEILHGDFQMSCFDMTPSSRGSKRVKQVKKFVRSCITRSISDSPPPDLQQSSIRQFC